MELPKILKSEDKGGVQVDLHVGKEGSAWGSGSDLASVPNSATIRRILDLLQWILGDFW